MVKRETIYHVSKSLGEIVYKVSLVARTILMILNWLVTSVSTNDSMSSAKCRLGMYQPNLQNVINKNTPILKSHDNKQKTQQ